MFIWHTLVLLVLMNGPAYGTGFCDWLQGVARNLSSSSPDYGPSGNYRTRWQISNSGGQRRKRLIEERWTGSNWTDVQVHPWQSVRYAPNE